MLKTVLKPEAGGLCIPLWKFIALSLELVLFVKDKFACSKVENCLCMSRFLVVLIES